MHNVVKLPLTGRQDSPAPAPAPRAVEDRGRSSVMMMADLRLNAFDAPHRIRVRDISRGGLKGTGLQEVPVGAAVSVELPRVGVVGGWIAWRNDFTFGIAFNREIDVDAVRTPVTGSYALAPEPPRPVPRALL